jgi:hypothetical protein
MIKTDIFKLQRIEWFFVLIIIMGGVAMYYIQGIIAPVRELISLAVHQNDVMIAIQEAQGNLTSEQRTKLISALQDNVNIVPLINSTLGEIGESLNALQAVVPDSNYTGQKEAIDNIRIIINQTRENSEDIEKIRQALNNTP